MARDSGHEFAKKMTGSATNRPSGGTIRKVEQVASTETGTDARFRFWAKIDGIPVRVIIDSGSSRDLIKPSFVRKHGLPTRKCEPYALTNFDGSTIGTVDSCTKMLNLRIGRRHEKHAFDLVPGGVDDVTLGIPWLRKANPTIGWGSRDITFADGMPNRVPPVREHESLSVVAQTREEMKDDFESGNVMVLWSRVGLASETTTTKIPNEYAEFGTLFQEESIDEALPKHQPWDHEIKLIPGREPTKKPIYPLSRDKAVALAEYVKENEQKGFIRKSQSPAGYPILFVPKPGGELRLCVDYRALNDITVKNSYPLPLISELQDKLQGKKWFTKFDIPGAFNRIRMKQGDEWKTAFRTRQGLYEYLVMPFGLTNAPATFQAFIDNVLREYLDEFVLVYIDDILVYSDTYEEHVKQVRKVLGKLEQAGLRLKLSKCEFHQKRVKFLGFIISDQGIEMDPEKVKSIVEWPTPTNKKEVQSFLGFANFYRKFIHGYSKTAAPLTGLTRNEVPFAWSKEAEASFRALQKQFASGPMLHQFNPESPIRLHTDASDGAIGAVISQPSTNDGPRTGKMGKTGQSLRWHPVAFHSRKLLDAETRYPIHDKELLAIVDAFRVWKVYLEGTKYQVQVLTDHKNLTFFLSTKELNRRLARWYEELSTFNFRIEHVKGSENNAADALSRRADYMSNVQQSSGTVLTRHKDGSLRPNTAGLYVAATMTIESEDLTKRILEDLSKDKVASEICEDVDGHDSFGKTDLGLLTFQERIYVPTGTRGEIFRIYHEAESSGGHQGIEKTLEKMSRSFYFPRMRKYVEDRVNKCDICIRTKHSRHKPYGELKSPAIPDEPWKSIAWDFVVKLPKSKERLTGTCYDTILVINDRLTKMAYFVPYKEASNAEDLAYAFLRTVVANHGLPEEIISDRDKLFTSKFWRSLMDMMGIKMKMSTAFHPQTDGQTERTNQTLEQYLRCYVNYRQDDWVSYLPVAQLAYNGSISDPIGMTPFRANYGFDPRTTLLPKGIEPRAQRATIATREMVRIHQELQKDLQFLSNRSAIYHNRKRSKGPNISEGDRVYLLRRNFKTNRPSDKLDYTKLGPFLVKERKGDVNYVLDLPQPTRKHPVFHISLLEKANPETSLRTAPLLLDQDDEEYDVEEILDCQVIGGSLGVLEEATARSSSSCTAIFSNSCFTILSCSFRMDWISLSVLAALDSASLRSASNCSRLSLRRLHREMLMGAWEQLTPDCTHSKHRSASSLDLQGSFFSLQRWH